LLKREITFYQLFTESYSRFNKLNICNSAGKKVALVT